MLIDGVLVALAYFLAFRLRFDRALPDRYDERFRGTVLPGVACSLVVFAFFRLYEKWWRYSGQRDAVNIVQAIVVATLFAPFYNAIAKPAENTLGSPLTLPTGVLALFLLLQLALIMGARFLARVVYERPIKGFRASPDARRVLIVGAGDGGRLVLREILKNPSLNYIPVGFVDDDPTKRGMRVEGVRVLGRTRDLARILDETEPDEVTIAIPSAPGTLRARVVSDCRDRGIPVRTLPTVFELLQNGEHAVVRQARPVEIEDILGREPVRMELDRVGRYLEGEGVMVTGAGGSIGSELRRQLARIAPRKLVLVDHAEDNLFRIQRELEEDRHVHPNTLAVVLADCKDGERMLEVMQRFRPDVVFHAAAYKHVPLVEANPFEAVRNNAIATRVVAETAAVAGAERFVLISTDKAVNPRTVMGASKAMAESIVRSAAARHRGTRFVSVRFGNVLGSSGSVVPIFRSQIERGGPVTVTHPEMTRYFMTIPEAVQLVIRAADLGGDGDVFVLEMGEPVRIVDLARNMIRLAGYEPETDIAIEYTAPRPGEQLHEQLLAEDERAEPTAEARIVRAVQEVPLDPARVEAALRELRDLIGSGDETDLAHRVVGVISDGLAPGGGSKIPR